MVSKTPLAVLVAIEGIDGAGKGTQSELLKARLQELGLKASVISFPRYHQTFFSESIMAYLNGDFGPLESVDPRLPALLYAGDRYESRPVLELLRRDNDVVILDRYVASNMAYQAARINPQSRLEFLTWLANLEYRVYQLPEADLTIYLDVPVHLAIQMVYQKRPRTYTTSKADIHERDTNLLAACSEVYGTLVQTNLGSTWEKVECVLPDGQMQEPRAINDLILGAIQRKFSTSSESKETFSKETNQYAFSLQPMRVAF